MLEYMDCDPVESIPISTLPVLPDWVRQRNLENLGATNVRIVSPVDQRETVRDNSIPEYGELNQELNVKNCEQIIECRTETN